MKTGRLRALAVTSAKRATMLPDIPTLAEAGVPGYDVSTWHGWVAAKGTDGDLTTFEIKARDPRKDVREELAKRLVGRGWGVRRLESRRVSLDDLFSAVVFREADPAATEPAATPAA